MLTKYDDYICHQLPATFDTVVDSTHTWTERVYCPIYDISGKIVFATGFCCYPNRNIIDAYSVLSINDKKEYYIRASRELRPKIDEVRVGPLSYDVIEPLKQVRWALDENEYGFSYEVEFQGIAPPIMEDRHYTERRGRIVDNTVRFAQSGQASGWVKIDGETYQIEPGTWRAERDHSWGIRHIGYLAEVGAQPAEARSPGMLFNFPILQIDDWTLHYYLTEDHAGKPTYFSGGISYVYGDPRPEVRLASVKHDYQFLPNSRRMKSGKIICTTTEGSEIEISMRALTRVYQKPSGYMLYDGFAQGMWMGTSWIDGGKLDLTNSKLVDEISFYEVIPVECRCGGKIGYGIVELVTSGQHHQYGA